MGAHFCYLFYCQSPHLGSCLFLYTLTDGLNTFNNMKQARLVANSTTGYREWIKSDQSHPYKKYINTFPPGHLKVQSPQNNGAIKLIHTRILDNLHCFVKVRTTRKLVMLPSPGKRIKPIPFVFFYICHPGVFY
jgi:hypothetical protein